jgi:uncharacterized MAPEG superfamily protein
MKPEMSLLIWAVALAFAQMLIAVQGAVMQVGLMPLIGNREKLPEITGWAGRAVRAHRNMLESMALFIPLVVIAVVAGKTNAMTLLGAQLFLWSRLAYAAVYFIGVPWLRTGVWAVSVAGMILIFLQLV